MTVLMPVVSEDGSAALRRGYNAGQHRAGIAATAEQLHAILIFSMPHDRISARNDSLLPTVRRV